MPIDAFSIQRSSVPSRKPSASATSKLLSGATRITDDERLPILSADDLQGCKPMKKAGRFSQAPSFTRLPWPLTVIDIEASSLDLTGYPIEVGLAFWPAPNEPIYGWSVLIRPTEEWRLHGHWSPESAKVHGIRGSDLVAQGRLPQQIAAALNEALGSGAVAWCDGGPYDTQ
jgi:hypothetical protein